jgi:hypothetical protein
MMRTSRDRPDATVSTFSTPRAASDRATKVTWIAPRSSAAAAKACEPCSSLTAAADYWGAMRLSPHLQGPRSRVRQTTCDSFSCRRASSASSAAAFTPASWSPSPRNHNCKTAQSDCTVSLLCAGSRWMLSSADFPPSMERRNAISLPMRGDFGLGCLASSMGTVRSVGSMKVGWASLLPGRRWNRPLVRWCVPGGRGKCDSAVNRGEDGDVGDVGDLGEFIGG